jgi:hypothetical protein
MQNNNKKYKRGRVHHDDDSSDDDDDDDNNNVSFLILVLDLFCNEANAVSQLITTFFAEAKHSQKEKTSCSIC